jgi:GT2 family glycosyltransferase
MIVSAVIIVPHFNDVARLDRCISALWPQLLPSTELLVVDNGSTESLGVVRAKFPTLRIIVETQKGAANARNRGVMESIGDVLCFIDSDCLPDPDWLETALSVYEQADLVGGQVKVFDETPPPRSGAQAFEAVFAFDFRNYILRKGFSGSGNLITKRSVFAAVGPFVHGLSEDLDWCRRASAKGYRLVYADNLVVSHPSRGDWPALRRKWRRLTDEGFALGQPTTAWRLKWAVKACAMPVSVLVHGPKLLVSPKLNGTTERLRGLATLIRLRFLRARWMLVQALSARA